MANFNNDFVPAFRFPIKWSTNNNTFDDSDKFSKTIGLCVPVDSMRDFINHCEKLLADSSNYKRGKIYDPATKTELENQAVIWINGKGLESKDGQNFYGNINPRKIEVEPNF